MAHTNIHDPLHVYSNRELPLTQLPVDNTIDTLQLSTGKIYRVIQMIRVFSIFCITTSNLNPGPAFDFSGNVFITLEIVFQ